MAATAPLMTVEPQPYGDVTELNTARLILDSVGKEVLADVMADYLGLLQTSAAIYEANGDYAQGIFTSGWCRKMDDASRNLCGTAENRAALACGKWLCHESCWKTSKTSIDTGEPADLPCLGGIRIYAVPVRVGGRVVGSINFGYGDPPTDPEKLREIAERYGLDADALRNLAESYQHRDPWIIDAAKQRLATAARLIGVMIERHQTEQELRRTSNELRLLNDVVEQSTQPFALVDRQGFIIQCNPAFERLTGYTKQELRQMVYRQLTPDRWHEAEAAHLAEAQSTGPTVRFQKEYRKKDGSIVPVEVVMDVRQRAPGEPQFISKFVTDITERKRAEDELQKNAREMARSNLDLEQFAYVASHDLQEPLRAVAGCAQVLQKRYEGRLDAYANELIGHTVEGVSRMKMLINDLLAYSRVSTHGQAFEPTNGEAVLNVVLANLETAVQEVHAVVTHDPLPVVRADRVQLTQLLQNLLGNAIKFHGTVPPRIHLGARRQDADWIFYVRDNGIGIQPEYFERIFSVFQRLHTRAEYEGTGIGLALCKKIVERHGGRIWVESEPHQGSTFSFTIPDRGANG